MYYLEMVISIFCMYYLIMVISIFCMYYFVHFAIVNSMLCIHTTCLFCCRVLCVAGDARPHSYLSYYVTTPLSFFVIYCLHCGAPMLASEFLLGSRSSSLHCLCKNLYLVDLCYCLTPSIWIFIHGLVLLVHDPMGCTGLPRLATG
jgi:hypothetical protein